jgi:hypothetical protein
MIAGLAAEEFETEEEVFEGFAMRAADIARRAARAALRVIHGGAFLLKHRSGERCPALVKG